MRTTPTESYKRYTDEQIERANKINIVQLAKMYGYQVKEKAKEARIPDMGGLIIDKDRNRWYCFSLHQGGGPIQFLMYLENMSWLESVETLLNEKGQLEVIRHENVKQEEPKQFVLPELNHSCRYVFAYLMKTRKIHPKVIQTFLHKGLIYESKQYHNCIFIGKDTKGVSRYAALRGTYTKGKEAFKGEAAGSDKRFGFHRVGTSNTLFVAESAIDVLSYISIYQYRNLERMIKRDHLLSLGGTTDIALEQYLFDHPEVTHIKLGLDNDRAGNEGCEQIKDKYSSNYEVERINIKEKDMNEVLIKDMKKRMEVKQYKQQQYVLQEEAEVEIV